MSPETIEIQSDLYDSEYVFRFELNQLNLLLLSLLILFKPESQEPVNGYNSQNTKMKPSAVVPPVPMISSLTTEVLSLQVPHFMIAHGRMLHQLFLPPNLRLLGILVAKRSFSKSRMQRASHASGGESIHQPGPRLLSPGKRGINGNNRH